MMNMTIKQTRRKLANNNKKVPSWYACYQYNINLHDLPCAAVNFVGISKQTFSKYLPQSRSSSQTAGVSIPLRAAIAAVLALGQEARYYGRKCTPGFELSNISSAAAAVHGSV